MHKIGVRSLGKAPVVDWAAFPMSEFVFSEPVHVVWNVFGLAQAYW